MRGVFIAMNNIKAKMKKNVLNADRCTLTGIIIKNKILYKKYSK